ncbi:MAG: hypothetical protein IJG15_00965 [Lachnospiraceae bacterium]|nr:hypothetical protein [Lachnospiraceae bacterium]
MAWPSFPRLRPSSFPALDLPAGIRDSSGTPGGLIYPEDFQLPAEGLSQRPDPVRRSEAFQLPAGSATA